MSDAHIVNRYLGLPKQTQHLNKHWLDKNMSETNK